MTAADLPIVVQIERASFSSPWTEATFAGLMDRDTVELLTLEDHAKTVIGYAVLWCVAGQGELANVAVATERRGEGLGRYLIEQVVDVARGRELDRIYLEVRASNTRAAKIYGQLGFDEVGTRRGYYRDPPEDARVMVLRLV